MKIKTISGYLTAYVFWIVILLLAAWLAYLSRTVFLSLAAVYYVDDVWGRQTLVRFLDRSYIVIVGLGWMALMILSEEAFRKAAKKGGIFRVFSAICGIELLIVFLFDLTYLGLQKWILDPLRIVILLFELLTGILLVVYWRKNRVKKLS